MNSLTELKNTFIHNKIDVVSSSGWYLFTANGDRWTLLHDVFYLNGTGLTKKQITEYLKRPQKKPSISKKMITNNNYWETYELEEIE